MTEVSAAAAAPDARQPYDLSVEPKTKEQSARAEVYLEHVLIKEIGPEFQSHTKTLAAIREKYAFHFACLKAVVVGKGRNGNWESHLKTKFPELNVRTVDRWIEAEIEKQTLPPWVVSKLTATKKPRPEAKQWYRLSLPLVFTNPGDRMLIEKAEEQLSEEALTEIIVKAVREEIGD